MDQHKNEPEEDRKVGTCGLCREQRDLRDSHLLPASVYKLLREPDCLNPNPVMVTRAHAGATSRQVTARLLCQDCEQRFSRNGERYVLAQCARRDSFPLRDTLRRLTPVDTAVVQGKICRLYEVGSALGAHFEEYLYFAASVFWRTGARTWVSGWRQFSLGVACQEQFRLYLLGKAEWPGNARLVVHVSSDKRVDYAIEPVSASAKVGTEMIPRHKFYIPGILFILFIGAPMTRDLGALNGLTGRYMWLCPFEADSLFEGFLSLGREAMKNPRTLRPSDVSPRRG
jgi:hypothetical protein